MIWVWSPEHTQDERTDFHKLSSDLHTYSVVDTGVSTHAHVQTHIQREKINKKVKAKKAMEQMNRWYYWSIL